MKLKRLVIVILFTLILLSSFACKKKSDDVLTLRIYNWEDYIDDGVRDDEEDELSVMEEFELYYKEKYNTEVKVVYNTFETNEYMLNVLKTGSESYDLVCPSDYIIQKMIAEDMLEKLDYNEEEDSYPLVENYTDYGSPYIHQIFNINKTVNKVTGEELSWSHYAIPYMWGTMGFTYRMDLVKTEDVQTWEILWNTDYAKKSTAKNSVHDTYVAGVMHVKRDELLDLASKYEAGTISVDDYNLEINRIMNDVSDETIQQVEEALMSMKENFYGFEVDNGKTDILNGTITINFAWSGDSVYSIDEAESEGVILGYEVPIEGSNVFFDGWVMPKGANVKLAQEFLNFLCDPEIASRNMDYIGYTSAIAGDEIWDAMIDNYSCEEDDPDAEAVDLTYFYEGTISEDRLTDGKAIIYVNERGRQFDAQYPELETLHRCGVMRDFGSQNEKVLIMWENVKCGPIGSWLWIGAIMLVIFIAGVAFFEVKNIKKKKRTKL